jgi:hypothetical protein
MANASGQFIFGRVAFGGFEAVDLPLRFDSRKGTAWPMHEGIEYKAICHAPGQRDGASVIGSCALAVNQFQGNALAGYRDLTM